MGGIKVKASVLVRAKRGAKFPAASAAAALSPARAGLQRDVGRAFDTRADPVTGKKWPPRKHPYPWPLLVKTGAMRQDAMKAAATARVTGGSLTATLPAVAYYKVQARVRRFLGASIGTVAIVRAGLRKAGTRQALRVLRGRT